MSRTPGNYFVFFNIDKYVLIPLLNKAKKKKETATL